MNDNLPKVFASKQRALVIAPAGCGKTELIARAVACENDGRQLILTHTHAGVRSLRDKLQKIEVSPRLYSVDTIAGFALKYAAAFPKSSGLGSFTPDEQEWDGVYEAGTQVLSSPVGKKIISSSYIGLYVDEYQDCTVIQHRLIMSLADLLPCRIVGDPLQGIFDFGNNVLINWFQDILPHFERLPDLEYPWRWHENRALGEWLLTVRDCLMRGKPIDMRAAPKSVKWQRSSNPPHFNQCASCLTILNEPGRTVAIHKLSNRAHSVAQKLGGKFTSMEEVESRDLFKWSKKLEQSTGTQRAVMIIDFGSQCMTQISTELERIKKKFEAGGLNISRISKYREIASALSEVATSDDLPLILKAFSLIEGIPGCALYRRELWHDMKKAIREYETGKYGSLQDAAWSVRNRMSILGRTVDYRTISRTLLIKGLEFDHAIVLNADELNAKELYVAMTRGSKSLTVLSSSPVIQKEKPVFGIKP